MGIFVNTYQTNSMFHRYNITNMDDKRNAFLAAQAHLEGKKDSAKIISLSKS